jgi:transposase
MENDVREKLFTPFVVPPLPKQALDKLPQYCSAPNQNNLAAQYYFWNLEIQKENQKFKKENKKLKEENLDLKRMIEDLKKKVEDLTIEKEKFLRMFFKRKRIIKKSSVKTESPHPRTKESYVRPLPKRINEEKETILKVCPCCQTKLSKKIDSYQRIVEDIPNFEIQKVKVIRYTINRYWCSKCKKLIRAKPLEVLPKCRLGINTLLYVLYSKHRLRLTQDLIQENLKTYFNLKISEGEINQLLNKGKQVFKQKWKEIIEKIKTSSVVNVDETGWRIGGENSWLWSFVGEKAVRYTISQSRGKGIPQKVLGKDFNGVVVSDFYAAYNQFKHKQRCWVHLLRKIKELSIQNPSQERIKLQDELQTIYQKILSFRNQSSTDKEKEEKANFIEKELIRIGQFKTKDQNLQKIYNLISKYTSELALCLKNPLVSPNNNLAERAIRPLVIQRKIMGGNRSVQGAQISEIILSVIETLRREKQNLFSAMKQLVLNYITSNA